MMKTKSKNIFKIIFVVLVFSFIIYRFFSSYLVGNKLDKSGCSTVGKTIKYEAAGRTGKFVEYHYKVNGIKYEDSAPFEKDVKVPGGKYLVKYLCDKPGVSKIYFDEPVK